MKKGAILLAINDLGFGGGQRTVVEEANELSKRGIDVHVVTTLAGGAHSLARYLSIRKDHIHHVSFRSLFDVAGYRSLVALYKTIKPEVVVSNLFHTNTITRSMKFCFPRVRVIVREGNIPKEKSIYVSIIDTVLSLLTYRVISNAVYVQRALKIQTLFAKKAVLYNGVSAQFFESNSEFDFKAARIREKIPLEAVIFFAAGSLVEKKGYRDLLTAFSRLSPHCHLIIVGEGYLRSELERFVPEHGLIGRVHFLGNISDMSHLYHLADVFVLTSHWEGVPNVVLEAMASALPVVVTNVGGISEVVDDGVEGYLVPSGDIRAITSRLSELSHDEALRTRLGMNGRKRAHTFMWPAHVDRLLELI